MGSAFPGSVTRGYCRRVDTASDEDVSAAFREGRPEGLRLAYERFGPLVYTLALRSVADVAEAEDVTQQVFVAAWQGRAGFDPVIVSCGGPYDPATGHYLDNIVAYAVPASNA